MASTVEDKKMCQGRFVDEKRIEALKKFYLQVKLLLP